MKYRINLLFLILFFLVQTVYVNACAVDCKVDFFIQKFPRLTFPETKKQFAQLTDSQRTRVWNKLNTNEEDTHKILPLALFMAQIEPLLQYAILSENFTVLEKRKSDESEEDYNKRIHIPHKIYNHSIYDLFRWKAVIDRKCKKKDCIKIRFKEKHFGRAGALEIGKSDLFSLTLDHITVIKKAQAAVLTQKELRLLTDLSDKSLETLKPFYSFEGNEIKFFYREPLLHTLVLSTLDMLPIVLLPLVYAHFYINPVWDAVRGTQDPLALDHNMKMELHNAAIDNLQKNFINGSEHLIKLIITPVPFSYTLYDYFTLFKPIIGMSGINGMFSFIPFFVYDDEFCQWKSKKGFTPPPPLIWSFFKSLYYFKGDLLTQVGRAFLLSCFPGFYLSVPISCTAYFFSKGLENDLPTLLTNSTIAVILAMIICVAADRIHKRIKTERNYWKHIDFSQEKFKDKSVKECINYYLNHRKIVIVD